MSGRVSFFDAPSPSLASNPLRTRDDLAKFLTDLLDPLEKYTSPGGSRIQLGYTGTHYDDIAAQLEGYARPLWGLASLLAGGGDYAGKRRWVDGLKNGTDPNSEEFWGNMRDKDQRMVECSPIGFFLSVAGEHTWDQLGEEGKGNLEDWLAIMNGKEMPNTNWLWFRVFANLGLKRAGSQKYNEDRMKKDLDHLDTFYIGEGWSRDGPEGVVQLDYYSSSFAIQFAQLVYSKLMREEDPVRSEEYRNRAIKFAQDFVHYFDDEGRAIPFGRSMIYRFAMSSFWGALAYADVELPAPLTWGVIKGLQLRNLRYWTTTPGAYNKDNSLTIGFCYPNMNLTENYNSPGSPYWCCKSFITLALPETHPFWTAKEEPFPEALRGTEKFLKNPLHVASNLGGHTFILSSGQQCSYPVKQSAAKYGKLAYSSAFGYSIPVGSLTLEELGGDNTLALSDDNGEVWKCRRETKEARIDVERGWLRSMWYPWKDVKVETWLLPPQKENPLWHVRVHRIRTGRDLTSAEGGFAIYGQGKDGRALEPSTGTEEGTLEDGSAARATSKAGVVGIAGIEMGSSRTGKAMRMDANTNIIEPRTVLPTLMGAHGVSQEDHWIVTAVFALPRSAFGQHEPWLAEWDKKPVDAEGILKLIQAS
ncbi:hypothetical protein D9611_006700 [Ephemerocybe angulata]|uniref:DUF2264 domain-containing protein n=1 Tax=Ephemerocybe angulata TaxID=980116 RepID=A0A8H5C889_9AGAR|nr:hypothetical protein D9611_006700 [Tulosesus angulatus]